MFRPPPIFTLFPYTTLFRSTIIEQPGEGIDTAYVSVNNYALAENVELGAVATSTGMTLSGNSGDNWLWGNAGDDTLIRSEEHTSELQSLRHLVCRLLLEKKK